MHPVSASDRAFGRSPPAAEGPVGGPSATPFLPSFDKPQWSPKVAGPQREAACALLQADATIKIDRAAENQSHCCDFRETNRQDSSTQLAVRKAPRNN